MNPRFQNLADAGIQQSSLGDSLVFNGKAWVNTPSFHPNAPYHIQPGVAVPYMAGVDATNGFLLSYPRGV